ncbi:MAG: hypothetical protein FJ110_05690 [Deltaproteobacteria bacterium]|nr:hypothetical protein [Deltaproteobacteria bacterium]
MARIIRQKVKFKGVLPEGLFDIYMDSKKHSAAVDSSASISKKVGGNFWVFGKNGLQGKNLKIVPKKMVVQSWRAGDWKAGVLDSILTIIFQKTRDGAVIELVHVNIPDDLYKEINTGWKEYYWQPWKKYLREKNNIGESGRLMKASK